MDDISHIGLIDTHTKGDSGNYDVYTLVQKGVLVVCTCLCIHAGVVGERLDAIGYEQLGKFLNLLTAEAVDDTTLAIVLLYEADDVVVYVVLGA